MVLKYITLLCNRFHVLAPLVEVFVFYTYVVLAAHTHLSVEDNIHLNKLSQSRIHMKTHAFYIPTPPVCLSNDSYVRTRTPAPPFLVFLVRDKSDHSGAPD